MGKKGDRDSDGLLGKAAPCTGSQGDCLGPAQARMPDKREKWLPRGPSARREPSVSRKLARTPSPRTKSRPGAKKERMKVVTLHLGGPPITAALVVNNCIHFMSACIHSFIYYSLNSYYNLREKAILRNKRTNLKERLARRRTQN